MARTKVDIYAVVTLDIDTDDEAAVRKMLTSEDCQEMYTSSPHDAHLTNVNGLPFPTQLSSVSYRKVVNMVSVTADDGTTTDGGTRPTDGAIDELEAEPAEEYCSTEGCTNTLDDGEGWDGYCGSCADRIAVANGEV